MTPSIRRNLRRRFLRFGVAAILCSIGLLAPTAYFMSETGRWMVLPSTVRTTQETGLLITEAERLFWRVMSREVASPGQVRCRDGGSLRPSADSGVAGQ